MRDDKAYHIECYNLLNGTDPDLTEGEWHRAACACKAIEEKTGAGWVMFREWSSRAHCYPGEFECRKKFDSVPAMGGKKTLEDIQGENPS